MNMSVIMEMLRSGTINVNPEGKSRHIIWVIGMESDLLEYCSLEGNCGSAGRYFCGIYMRSPPDELPDVVSAEVH